MIQLNPDYEAIFAPVNIDDDCDSIALIYDAIMKHDIDAESAALLKAGHDEVKKTECYDNYGCPSYIR